MQGIIINPCPQSSLRKQPKFRHATTGFPAKWQIFSTQQHSNQSDLGSDASSVWNLFARFSDVISQGNLWWRHEMSAVFSALPAFYGHLSWEETLLSLSRYLLTGGLNLIIIYIININQIMISLPDSAITAFFFLALLLWKETANLITYCNKKRIHREQMAEICLVKLPSWN